MSTAIEWTDETWNPVTGCTKVSPGCDHCYAERVTERFHEKGSFERVVLHPDRLDKPLRWRKPRKVFVNSMSDLFHEQVPEAFIALVFAVMAEAPQHTFQILTKRHARMRSLLSRPDFIDLVDDATCRLPDLTTVRLLADNPWPDRWPLPNVHLVVSVEDQRWANIRIPALLDTPAAVRGLSCEPLLGPLDLEQWTWKTSGGPVVDWVIVGGESGPGARPMHPDWARSIRNQCLNADVPFLFKQWGEWAKVESRDGRHGDVWVLPETGATSPWLPGTVGAEAHRWGPHRDELMRRVGKKAAGRELDGRTWDQYPAALPEAVSA